MRRNETKIDERETTGKKRRAENTERTSSKKYDSQTNDEDGIMAEARQ